MRPHRRLPACSLRSISLSLVAVLSVLALASPAWARTGGALPPAFGKLCGKVSGGAWHYKGQSGTQYNVTATSGVCGVALNSVGALTKQTPHAGAIGPNTLAGPKGFSCAGTGTTSLGLKPAQSGTCGDGAKHFLWAPHLK